MWHRENINVRKWAAKELIGALNYTSIWWSATLVDALDLVSVTPLPLPKHFPYTDSNPSVLGKGFRRRGQRCMSPIWLTMDEYAIIN